MTWLGWPARRECRADQGDLLEPLSTCADEMALLAGRPCCCLAANGSGSMMASAARIACCLTERPRWSAAVT